jgi:hypothetical protein
VKENEQYFLRQEKENKCCSLFISIEYRLLFYFLFEECHFFFFLLRLKEEKENQLPTVPKVDRQTTSQAASVCRTYY